MFIYDHHVILKSQRKSDFEHPKTSFPHIPCLIFTCLEMFSPCIKFLTFCLIPSCVLAASQLAAQSPASAIKAAVGKAGNSSSQSADTRLFLIKDTEVILKADRAMRLHSGSAVEVVGREEDQKLVRIQLFDQEVTIPAQIVETASDAEDLLKARALSPAAASKRPWGRFLLEQERYQEAAEVWEEIAKRSETNPLDHYLAFRAHLSNGRYLNAVIALDQLIERRESIPEETLQQHGLSWHQIYGLKGRCHLKSGSMRLAFQAFSAAVEADPNVITHRVDLFETMLILNRFEDAVEQEKEIRKLTNSDPEIQKTLDERVWKIVDLIFNTSPQSSKARYWKTRLPILIEERTPPNAQLAERTILIFLIANRPESADELLHKSQQQYPDDDRFLLLKADRANTLGEAELAIELYSKILKQDPEQSEAREKRARLYYREADFQSALVEFQKLIKSHPERSEFLQLMGLCHLSMGQTDKAREIFNRCIKQEPSNHRGWNSLARLLATYPDENIRNAEEAIQAGRKACELTNQQVATYLDTLAAAYAEAGNFEEAVTTQINAIDKLTTSEQFLRAEFQSRLQLYQNEQPYREDPRHADYR